MGDGNAEDPEGVFAQWAWDGSELSVGTDRYGMYPLYYFESDSQFAVSPSISRLLDLGIPAALDLPALAVFLRMQTFLGCETPFTTIRAFPPGAHFTWRNGVLQKSSRALPRPAHSRLARDAAIDRHIELFRDAVSRRHPPEGRECVVPLSGGRDSRHILLELLRQGVRPKLCVTTDAFCAWAREDARVAPKLAAAAGVAHVVVKNTYSQFEARRICDSTTGWCEELHEWAIAFSDFLARSASVIYDGLAGDVLTETLHLTREALDLFDSGRFRDLAVVSLTESAHVGLDTALRAMLPATMYQALDLEPAIERVSRELALHADMPNPVSSFRFWNRARRAIALYSYRILGRVPLVHAPFLDHALIDFLMTLPGSYFLGCTFHAEVIRRAYPEFAHLPFAQKAPFVHDGAATARFARELARHFFLRHKPKRQFVRRAFLAPRLASCLLSKRYAASTYWYAPLAYYLLGLESRCGCG